MGQENSLMTHIKSGTSEAELDRIIHKHPEFVTGTDGYGWTPLHYAVLTQKFNTARTLIKKGADIHARNYLGQTPLSMCAGMNKEDELTQNPTHIQDPSSSDDDGNRETGPFVIPKHPVVRSSLDSKGSSGSIEYRRNTPMRRVVSPLRNQESPCSNAFTTLPPPPSP